MDIDRKALTLKTHFGPWRAAPAPLDEVDVLFAIGDSHGYASHLAALHDLIGRRIDEAYDPSDAAIVWLGDYIDRGPQPLECLDLARAGVGRPPAKEIRLLGNHDDFLLQAVSGRGMSLDELENWLWNGGNTTLAAILPGHDRYDPAGLARDLAQALGPARLAFLRSLSRVERIGTRYVVAHAGLDPKRPFEKQKKDDLIWIREPFLEPRVWTHDFVVVHGHTPTGPSVRPHRIGADSGVFRTGILTAVEIAGARMRFLHASSPGARAPNVDDGS